jgi:hypothetical protein
MTEPRKPEGGGGGDEVVVEEAPANQPESRKHTTLQELERLQFGELERLG